MTIRKITPTATAIEFKDVEILISYETPVAIQVFNEVKVGNVIIKSGVYRTSKKWSVTTSTHINRWAGYKVSNTLPQTTFDNLFKSLRGF